MIPAGLLTGQCKGNYAKNVKLIMHEEIYLIQHFTVIYTISYYLYSYIWYNLKLFY